MNEKMDKLVKTLLQSGMAASEGEAKRMAESMVSTEEKVQSGFDNKREEETRYGASPRTPLRVNPVDGTPIKPEVEQSTKRDFSIKPEGNPHLSPEEYSAQRLNIAKSTSELIEEEKMTEEKSVQPASEEEYNEVANETSTWEAANQEAESNDNKASPEELEIPRPDDSVEENKELPNLNPLDEEPAVSGTPVVEEKENTEPEVKEEVQSTPESNTSSEGKPLPQTQTPERPQKSKEELEKMEESKVDLTKIFKV